MKAFSVKRSLNEKEKKKECKRKKEGRVSVFEHNVSLHCLFTILASVDILNSDTSKKMTTILSSLHLLYQVS